MIALLFPGQGAQEVGMGRALAEAYPRARETFDEANDALGYDITDIIFNGPAERLVPTDVCQPAILAMSVAAWRVAADQLGPSSCEAAQASTPAMNSSDRRNVREGSRPVAGRPAPGRAPPIVFGLAFFTNRSYLIQA